MKNILNISFKQFIDLFKDHLLVFFQIIAAFILPIKPLLILMIMMIGIDTITGLIKARKLKQEITSRKLSNVVSKILLYCLGIIAVFSLDKYLLGEFIGTFTSISLFLTKITAIFFCGIEFLSIHENIRDGFGINLFQTFKNMLLRAKEVKEDIQDVAKKD